MDIAKLGLNRLLLGLRHPSSSTKSVCMGLLSGRNREMRQKTPMERGKRMVFQRYLGSSLASRLRLMISDRCYWLGPLTHVPSDYIIIVPFFLPRKFLGWIHLGRVLTYQAGNEWYRYGDADLELNEPWITGM